MAFDGYPYKINISPGAVIGREIRFLDEAASTNDEAKQFANDGAPEGTVVFAYHQTRGKGRIGRTWHSAPGTGIYMTVILRPLDRLKIERLSGITLVIGLACADALKETGDFDIRIKWPNDILVNRKKVVGILAESVVADDVVLAVVVGIGVNVNNDVSEFPAEMAEKATSLLAESGGMIIDVSRIAERLIHALDTRYKAFLNDGISDAVLSEYKEKCVNLHRRIRAHIGGKAIEGVASDITKEGGLVIDLDSGEQQTVCSGEVSIRTVDGRYV